MKKLFLSFSTILIFLILLCGCGNKDEIINGKEARIQTVNNSALLIDVRSEEEYNEKHLSGAISLPLEDIENDADKKIPSKDKIIIVYCNSGVRSKKAKTKLEKLGYKNVYNMGAMSNWYE